MRLDWPPNLSRRAGKPDPNVEDAMDDLKIEELEERIAPDVVGGTPGTGTSNSNNEGTEVSGGSTPQPEPSGR